MAPFAGPESSCLGALQGVVELNILGVGDARGARRPTVNAGGGNRVPSMTMRRLIAGDNLRPTRIVGHR